MTASIRFESAVSNRHGYRPGVFALVNGLARAGRLSDDDVRWHRRATAAGEAAYRDPSSVDPTCYDRARYPGARSWFRAGATTLLDLTQGWLTVLDRYDIAWVELRTSSPGHIVYDDDVQVVALPLLYPDDWPSLDSPSASSPVHPERAGVFLPCSGWTR